jgi:hypothetical protein
MQNQSLYDIFAKAFPNTMSTTVQHYNLSRGNESVYIITGDIEAMWLRDSTNQFIPYIRMLKNCTHIDALTRGLLNTQAELIIIDGYTNAFKKFEVSKYLRPLSFSDESETLILGIPVDLIRKREFATQHIWSESGRSTLPLPFCDWLTNTSKDLEASTCSISNSSKQSLEFCQCLTSQ